MIVEAAKKVLSRMDSLETNAAIKESTVEVTDDKMDESHLKWCGTDPHYYHKEDTVSPVETGPKVP